MSDVEPELVCFSAGAEHLEVMRKLHEKDTCYGRCRALAISGNGDGPREVREGHTERKL